MQHSEMALITNEGKDVVFQERECSLDLLVSFSIKGKGKRKTYFLSKKSRFLLFSRVKKVSKKSQASHLFLEAYISLR